MTETPKHIQVFASDARKRGDVDALLGLLTSTESAARETAIVNLGKLGDPIAVKPLTRFLNARDPGTRISVLRALGRISDESAVPDVFETASGDQAFLVRITAMETLGALGDQRAAPLLGAALHAPDIRYPRWFRK